MAELPVETLSRERPLPSEEYSEKVMPRVLHTLDLTTIFIVVLFTSPIVMSSIAAGPATFTYWIFAALTYLVPCIIVTAQLGMLYPNEGSLYNWTHKAFGGYWSFFVAFCTWIPCVLIMVSGADIVVGYIQGLNPGWITTPWQHGLAMIGVLIISGFISVQRFRTVQHFVNFVVGLLVIGILIVGLSGVVWLATGHTSATDYSRVDSWFMSLGDENNTGNFAVFGLVVYAYLGMEAPLNMAAEIVGLKENLQKRRSIIVRHLFLGTLFVLVGYLIDSFGVLTVLGQSATGHIFAFVTTADTALGTGWGNIVALAIISFFLVEVAVYNYAYARLLFVAGIDQRLPASMARLNRNRVPANAVIVQTIIASAFTAITFMVIPYFVPDSESMASKVYNVSQGAATVLWVASTAVLFVNVIVIYFRDRQAFLRQRIFPMFVIWGSVILGLLTSIAAIVDTLFYSWIINQITNEQWRYIVGSITVICLIIAGIGSMWASGQAEWEKFEHIAQDHPTKQPQA